VNIGAEAVEILFDISEQELLVVGGGVVDFPQRPFAGVVEDIAGLMAQGGLLQIVQLHFVALKTNFFEHGVFGGFEQRIEAAQHHHRQNHIAIFAAHIDITQAVIGDAPDKRNELVVRLVGHEVERCFIILFTSRCHLVA